MSTVTLVYNAEQGLQDSVAFAAKLNAVPVFDGELELLGMALISNNTVSTATGAKRTIVLNVEPQGEAQFPSNDEKKDATRNLYTQALALRTPTRVTADEPVVGP